MRKTFKGALAFAFCIVTIFTTMLIASAIGAPKAKVGAVTYNTVTISWAKVKDADFYEIQRSTDGKKWTTLNKSVKATSYKDSNKLTAGKTYKYRVRAVNDRLIGKDEVSAWSSAVAGKPVPQAVTGLKASAVNHNSAKLSWKKVAGASGYQVQVLNGKTWKNYKTVKTNTITVNKLALGKTYQYRVRAFTTVSKKAVYGTVSAAVKVTPVLKAPSTFVLKGVTSSTLKLAWSSVDGAKGYEVYNAATKKWINVKKATSYTVENLKAGTKYSFEVRAYSGSYKGPKSVNRTYITTPAVPGKLKVSATTTSLTFSWGKVTGAAGYQPSYYDYATKKWTNLSTQTGTSVTISKLKAGTKYAVRVRAFVKNSNVKDISATAASSWTAKLDTYTVPSAPKSISLTGISTSSLTLSWPAVSGATSYEYYNPVSKKWVSTGKDTKVTLSKLAAGTSYTFKVRAKVSNRTSAESAGYTFKTLCATPGSISVTAATTSSLTFSWSKVTGAAGYQPAIYDSATKKWTSLSATTGNSVTVKDLAAGRKYAVRVRAYVKNSNVSGIGGTTYTVWKTSGDTYTVPSAPKSISLTGISTSSLTLSWPAVSGATSYEYYNPVSKKWISTGADTKVTVSSLSAGTKYTFKVRAKVSNRTSAESAGYSFVTLAAKVGGLKVSSLNSSAIKVTWNAVKGASGYQIDYKKADAKSWTKLATTASTSATASNLNGYTDYQFRVRAYVKNSNVSGISGTSYASYSSTLSARTKIAAPVLKAAATSTDTITLSWSAVAGATSYVIEKFDTLQNEWMVYDFNSAKWNYYEFLSEESVITTTLLTLEDKGKYSTRSDVYRVIATEADGYEAASEPVTGFTSDIGITIGDYNVTLALPINADVNLYQIYARNPDNSNEIILETAASKLKTENGKHVITLNFAPGSYQSLLVIGKNTDSTVSTKVTDWMTFLTKDLKIVTSTSDSNYNASVNSQLLYLARAINNTKAYKGDITVNNKSEVSYSIDYLKIKVLGIPYEAKSAKEVANLFKTLGKLVGEDIDFPTQESDKVDTTLSFKDGKCTTEGYENAKLKLFIEPTSNSTKTSYVYNSLTNQAAWKNGFENVTTTKNSDGTYTINATLKKETTNTNYHSGFISSFDMSDFSGEGFEMKYFNVGKSTISAVIDSEGYLKSYTASAPYAASMVADEDTVGSMTMNMSGKTNFNYTVTR